jgi:hypothetical protein
VEQAPYHRRAERRDSAIRHGETAGPDREEAKAIAREQARRHDAATQHEKNFAKLRESLADLGIDPDELREWLRGPRYP